jgi:two-component system response regulator CssR
MDVLLYLIENLGTSKAREEILSHVWGTDYFGSERAVDDVIRRVRKKMPRLNLETVYGNGYRIVTS